MQLFVLCRDRPDFARQAIRSAMRQTLERFQILVSDNSTGNAVRSLVESEFPGLEYRRRTGNLGVLDHFNRCLDEASADYVCLFHDDDLLSPRYAEAVLEAIGQFPDAAAIGTNAWVAEEGRRPHLSFRTTGKTHFVRDARQLATHYFSRYQPGIAPFPAYVYATARLEGLRFDRSAGKYADVIWLLRVAERGGMVWIVEPLMTYRLHASNDSRQESIGARLKLFAFFKQHRPALGQGLVDDFRFFVYKKALELDRRGERALPPARRRTLEGYLARYRCLRFLRLDHHRFLLQKARVRILQRLRPWTSGYPRGAA